MENNYIQFKKQRELGQIISVTFEFIRENYKNLFSLLVKFAGPAFLLMVAALVYYSYSVPNNIMEIMDLSSGNFLIALFILAVTLVVFYASLYTTIFHYIRSYIDNQGNVEESEVRAGFKSDFGKMILLLVITGILMIAGFILLLIPGIYLMVPFSIAGAIMVIKDNWWMTFITLIVMGILVYVISLVFQIPLIIYTIIKMMAVVQEGSAAGVLDNRDWVLIVLQVLSSIIQYTLSIISIIAVAFIYFNLNEEKNLSGTFERIENLGN
jgi:hypothetical protein